MPGSKTLRIEALEPRRLLAVITVDTHIDEVDPTDGLTTLREAVQASNVDIDADEIRFAPWLHGGTIRLAEGALQLTGELSIVGPGADLLTIDASGSDPTPGTNNGDGSRIFYIGNDEPDLAPQVRISGLTLTGGDAANTGGAIWAERFEFAGFATGAITFADEQLTATGSANFSVAQRESTGTLSLLTGSFEISTLPEGAAEGATGATGSGVDIVLTDSDDDSDAFSAATYDAPSNEIRITADFNSNGGTPAIRIQDLADVISNIQTSPGTYDFVVGTVTNALSFLTAADATTHANVLTGGLDASATESIEITAVAGAVGNLNIAFVEQAGVGATPVVQGNPFDGYQIVIDSGNTETTLSNIASAVESIPEVAAVTTTSTRTFNGALDNTPAALTTLTGARDAGTDVITITAAFPGPALNRNLAFSTSNASLGEISVNDDGTTVTVSIDNTSQYHLSDIAAAISTLTSFNAELSGDGSGTFEADNANDDTLPVLTNVTGGLDPATGLEATAAPKTLVLDGVHISNNHALFSGGGVYSHGSVEVINSTIANNRVSNRYADTAGGGVYARGSINVVNSTVSGNEVVSSNARGGGIFSESIIHVTQSTITNNRALGVGAVGGGIANDGDSLVINGSIVAANHATQGMDDVATSELDAAYSLFGSLNGLSISGTNIQIGVDPLLAPLGNYGGPTPTHLLFEGSPAINAGDPTLVSGVYPSAAFDQRGEPFQRVDSGRIDLGAVELHAIDGDFDHDRLVTGSDFLVWQRTAEGIESQFDLLDWHWNYGRPPGQLAPSQATATASESVPTTTEESIQIAGLAMELNHVPARDDDDVVEDDSRVGFLTRAEPASTLPLSDVPVAHELETIVQNRERINSELAWLTDELLERVFG